MPRHTSGHRGARLHTIGRALGTQPDRDDGIDYQHLSECVDPHCCYCNDEKPAVSTMDEQERAFLEALTRAA